MTLLELEEYEKQLARWPPNGKVVQAQFTDDEVVVYQAFRKEIAEYAVAHQHFGGEFFNWNRTSWIKPNFTWMMYRCGWGEKKNQERVLAIRIKRSFFDIILSKAIHSSFDPTIYESCDEWKKYLRSSDVVLQWDPDHEPFTNHKCPRRAIQLGLRPNIKNKFQNNEVIVGIEDVTDFVRSAKNMNILYTPRESVYPVTTEVGEKLGITMS